MPSTATRKDLTSPRPTAGKLRFSTHDLAAHLGVSIFSIDRWAHLGEISYTRLGRGRWFSEEDVSAFLARRERPARKAR